ncbi:hypothetical protein [Candidatus Sororendozoicomonas aggregata]|uniref:hypothetical protein n=1 Tax=Candidatus Sororendozoicomonas aggregata TaxID=3073239 RepID=UPI002ED19AA6
MPTINRSGSEPVHALQQRTNLLSRLSRLKGIFQRRTVTPDDGQNYLKKGIPADTPPHSFPLLDRTVAADSVNKEPYTHQNTKKSDLTSAPIIEKNTVTTPGYGPLEDTKEAFGRDLTASSPVVEAPHEVDAPEAEAEELGVVKPETPANRRRQHLEKGLAAGVVGGAVASGAGIATINALQPGQTESLLTSDNAPIAVPYNDEALQMASAATDGLALAGSVYQATRNEKQIRQQKIHAQAYLKNLATVTVLARRKKQKKALDQPITVEEIKQFYKDEQLSEITKNTLIPGASGTLAVSGSLLTLGMAFPPFFPVFAAASAGTGGAGLISTAAATAGNRARLKKAMDKTFSDEKMQRKFNTMAEQLEADRQALSKPDAGLTDPQTAERQLLKAVDKKFEVDRLNKASQIMLGSEMVARISGMSKYGLPALGSAAVGLGATLTGVMVSLSAATNFKERRRKLDNVPQAMAEVISPDLDRKRFVLFGATMFERYLKKDWADLQKKYKGLSGKNHKATWKALQSDNLSQEVAGALRACRQDCARALWEEQLTKFAKQQKPPIDFQALKSEPEKLRDLLKRYAIKSIGEFAHNDTFSNGRNNTLRLSLIGTLAGVFFLPMLGVAAGVLVTGLGVSKGIAVYERKVFEQALSELFDEPGEGPESKMAHVKVNSLIDTWCHMLTDV